MNARHFIFLAVFFALAIPFPAFASPTYHYQGAIGDRLNVELLFTWQDDGKISGMYRYANFGQVLELEQASVEDGVVTFRERPWGEDGKTTGLFRGEFADNSASFAGTWSSPDGKRSLPFSLHKVASSVELVAAQSDRYEVHIAYPKFTAADPFHAAVNEQVRREAQKLFDKTLAEFKADMAKFKDDEIIPYSYTTGVQVMEDSENMISILYDDDCDNGGLHPNSTYRSANYAWRDGNLVKVTFSDLIGKDAAIARRLNALCVSSLKRQKASWPGDVKFGANSSPVVNVTTGGLLFSFSPYQAGSYAEGNYCVMIPFSQFRDKLNRKSLLTSAE
jgi:hypothetical protein